MTVADDRGSAPAHPRPAPDADTAPFWERCRHHELALPRCATCGTWRHPSRPVCARCRSRAHEWVATSGRATVHTYTICHPPVLPAFTDRVPYNAVVVELDEGPFLVSNVVDCPDDEVHVGMRVRVRWVDVDDTLTLPCFAPA